MGLREKNPMRRLLLLRHAKSAWPDGTADVDRPLAERGRDAAPRMGAYIADEGLAPDLALVSPARRARETWDLVKARLGDVPMRLEPRLYESTPVRLLTVVGEVQVSVRTLLLIGHNPAVEDLARQLAEEGDRDGLTRMARKYPTAGLAVLDFPVETWTEAVSGSGCLERFATPKSLGYGEDE
jgi:phosphohistidine phosphatase